MSGSGDMPLLCRSHLSLNFFTCHWAFNSVAKGLNVAGGRKGEKVVGEHAG